jgi:hypothetical protein
MPVSWVMKLEIVIDLGAAKRLGTNIPDAFLTHADEAVE